MTTIGIIGAGNIGSALATRLASLGHTVKIANSRGPDSLRDHANSMGVAAVSVEEAVAESEIVIIAIPLGATSQLKDRVGNALRDVPVVIDTGNYIPLRDGNIAALDGGLPETEWVSRQLGVSLVKAFNSLTADSLARRGMARNSKGRIALPIASDDANRRMIAERLVDELGFDPYNAGTLAQSWRQQPGQPAYCVDATLSELPPLLARADRNKAAVKRDQAMALMAKLPAAFPPEVLVRVSRLAAGLDILKPRTWYAALRLGVALLRPAR